MARSFYTTHSGGKMITPGGQTETGPAMAAAGMSWGNINCADGNGWIEWQKTIASLRGAGLRVAVAGRVINFGDPLLGVETLMNIAIAHGAPCHLNIEDEFKTIPPALFEARIKKVRAAHPGWTRELVIDTVGWLYNAVDYTPIAHRPVLLQCHPHDMKWTKDQVEQKTNDCIVHAKAKGFTDIGVTFESDDYVPDPSWYTFWGSKPRSYFTGDWIGAKGEWPQWAVK